MGINQLLAEEFIQPLRNCAEDGICFFTSAATEIRLPSGDYIDKHLLNQYIKEGKIDNNLYYTSKFFRERDHCFPCKDRRGVTHFITFLDLTAAIFEKNKRAEIFIRQRAPKNFLKEHTSLHNDLLEIL